MSQQSFADLGVSRAVVGALSQDGVSEPFAVQQLVIGDILAGRDVLARSPTGSGKTLAFGIPLADRIESDGPRPAALILAPTRELASQIAVDIRSIAHSRALRVTAVYGGAGLVKQAREAATSHILVATPGRLEDLLNRRAFSLKAIRMLILDEADRMLDMGFKPAVDRIVRACPQSRQTLFFSATLDGEAGRTARSYTTNPVTHEHGPTQRRAAAEVEHRFLTVSEDGRIDALVSELESDRDLALVFVRTKRGADRLVKRLGAQGVDALAMHGNKSQRQREVALARFEAGKVKTLVATDVAARGIDISGISHVINFDPPGDHESYVHRVGRTGRAGRQGVAITLVGRHEQRELAGLADHLGIEHDLGSSTSGTSGTGGGGYGSGRGGPSATPGRRRKPGKGSRPGSPGGSHRNSRPAQAGPRDGAGSGRRRRQGAGRRSGTHPAGKAPTGT